MITKPELLSILSPSLPDTPLACQASADVSQEEPPVTTGPIQGPKDLIMSPCRPSGSGKRLTDRYFMSFETVLSKLMKADSTHNMLC